jgi:hypothetical protein
MQSLLAFRAPKLRTAAPAQCTPAPLPAPVLRRPGHRHVAVNNNWRTFGPTAEYSDGDAEYYQLTSRLSQQYEWFAPGPQQQEPELEQASTSSQSVEQDQRQSSFGLSERQIRALGLAGPRSDLPDPVCALQSRRMSSLLAFNLVDLIAAKRPAENAIIKGLSSWREVPARAVRI